MRSFILTALLAIASIPAYAADPPKKPEPLPGDAMIEKYLSAEVARISKKELDGATTRAEWEKRRPRLKQEYFEMLGLWPLPEKTPLHATVTGTVDGDDIVVEKVHFQSKPGLYVTGNLYRPKKIDKKMPAVLYVCGHSGAGRLGGKVKFQDHGIWFAHNGYICLIIDTLQLGEIAGIHHGTYGLRGKDPVETRFWWQARGYTPAGVECWNGVRAIDYLISRTDVDADKIAVTGISGGGAATLWITAADERVKCAVPVSGMSDLESYVTNKIINGHCDCMLMINTYQWEWTTIAALVAPRPMLFANSDMDPIFPMDGNRRIIARLRTLYKMHEKPELVDEYVSKGGHAYRPDLRRAVFKWINKHIKSETGDIKDTTDYKQFPEEQLRVFAKDEDAPKDALNGKIDETFVPMAKPTLPEEGKFEEWRAGLMKELRGKSFRSMSERVPAAKLSGNQRTIYELETEPNLFVLASAQRGDEKSKLRTVAVVGNKLLAESRAAWGDLMDKCEKDSFMYFVMGRGMGEARWTAKSPPNYVARSHALLGRTVDDGRVRDVIASARYLDAMTENKYEWRIIANGQAGILAAYAALFEPSIKEVTIVDPPTSHRDGPIFLNVLRVCDIPEALGMLAPRKLTLINAKDKVFDRTAEIYKRAGAADRFERK
jgi:cephalosporin-C deacetylase-like acetyl esterase